ncbi:amino acid permease [Constantimarinum furrinae]|uniref:Arginine/agmatine antiporter n=1 Tax=Constantimarinum furrinae TaxID=2562285 RepID=A0A7G8PS88_9FLAO|nr:amino acid permease [Constantimarinum furrinae]QNJ97204.1 putative amino acid permease [Constantimarinum furrinae]
MTKKTQKIGLLVSTSLVIGNMIGAGIFVLPASLAKYGGISILGWIFSAAGALILAKVFSNFSKILVGRSGGPYTFSQAGFGDFIGFLVAWGYWISCWVGNAAIALAAISALSFFFPVLETNANYAILAGLSLIWFLTWINSRGIKESGKIQILTTVLKLIPLVLIILMGAFFFSVETFPEFNLTGESNLAIFPVVAVLTLYAFLGIESATIPAGNVKDPEVTVPRATMLGTIITTLVYILSTIVLFGIIPNEVLSESPTPFADAGELIGGKYVGYLVAAGAAIAAIGALNGWILITGQMSMAMAKDDLFPKLFKKSNSNGAPLIGLIIGSVLTSALMLMNFTEGLVDQFEFALLLTTLTCLVPYLFVSASYVLVLIEKKFNAGSFLKTFTLGILGFAYSMWSIYGSGQETVFYGFLLLFSGVPIYLIMKWNHKKDSGKELEK